MSAAPLPSSNAPHDIIDVDANDLPVSCPGPQTPVWNLHPKIYLDVATNGKALCPYCGTEYRLKPGTLVRGH